MASRFGSHLKVWFLLVPVLSIAVMPAIPERSLFEVPEAETRSLITSVGQERADDAVRRANDTFRHAFVDNGLLLRTLNASGSVGGLNDGGFSTFAHTWTENFWLLVYRMLFRAMVMKLWIVGTLLFAFGMFIDGTARRKIKASAAGFVSPLSFHLAGHGLLLVTGTLFGVLVVPLPVLAGYWVCVAALLGAFLWKAAESFQSSR
ncbi:hypothetical protein BVER_03545 [Candidatus Burkholderia verschuerenii]|uniref:DUF4400 domain-containing protein n=1 Tax=Candidatus Burkholderia verschuerenii TaxID=242163 RepID=A0A0L0M505_9BURK|nr:DUF4400 domain-containing protein [Candidatus Burkholderia verschuerenii]KND57722.1 hypothetical protein BVER_03545 [Candidatus Burkholderia verschuerenii]